jgi:protein-S-isoprenylcysteine O-methyltransferase Ste14
MDASSSFSRVLPPTYFLGSLALMAVLHWSFPVAQLLRGPWRLLGIVPIAAGAAVAIVTDGLFKRVDTTIKPLETASTLVTSGFYLRTRNPMYLSMVVILLGSAIVMGSLAPALVVPVFAAAMQWIFIRVEERMLEDTFGERYREYKRRVRRWI